MIGQQLTEEELEEIPDEEVEELEQTVDEFIDMVQKFESDVDKYMEKINDSPVYQRLDGSLYCEVGIQYYFGEPEE